MFHLFSPELQKAKNEIELWKAAYTIKTGMKYSSRKFQRLEKATVIFGILKQTPSWIKEGEKLSFATYWSAKGKAQLLRDNFMEKAAEDLAEEKYMEVSAIIKQQIENEKSRRNNRKIKFALKKLNKSVVTTVEIEGEDGLSKELTSRHDFEEACIQENFSKYTQTENTVCMQEPLKSLL